jgi:hypothetical protein
MKKILAITMMIVMTLSVIVGCNGGSPTPSISNTPSVSPTSGIDLSQDWSVLENTDPGAFETIGLYTWEDDPTQHDFWKASGITTLQFCDRGWYYNAEAFNLKTYLKRMTECVDSAKEAGFDVYVILFSNIEQYMGPNPTEPTGLGVKFHPSDEVKLADRLYYIGLSVEAMSKADGFTFFAGDPGGIPNGMGPGTVDDYIEMALKVSEVVREKAPDAAFNINPWAVTMFETPNVSAMTAAFWLKETVLSKIIIDNENLLGKDIGIELPGHDHYRPLAIRLLTQTNNMPEKPFPQKEDVDKIFAKNTPRVWAWPYFLLDEADDGDRGVNNTVLPQIETRYIEKYISDMRETGVNGIIGSWSYAGYQSKMLNTYAFGRLASDVTATSEGVIAEFAQFIAKPESRDELTEILKYIENNSNFENKLPDEHQLDEYDTSIESPQQALEILATVEVNDINKFPLANTPEKYLQQLKERLELMIG